MLTKRHYFTWGLFDAFPVLHDVTLIARALETSWDVDTVHVVVWACAVLLTFVNIWNNQQASRLETANNRLHDWQPISALETARNVHTVHVVVWACAVLLAFVNIWNNQSTVQIRNSQSECSVQFMWLSGHAPYSSHLSMSATTDKLPSVTAKIRKHVFDLEESGIWVNAFQMSSLWRE